MKVLVTGGNRGLGAHLVQALGADTISRSTGLDITTQIKEIAEISLQYDVFVNNAFDGPPQESWANFAQSQLYFAVYDAWKQHNKAGHIFNIGSIGARNIVAPEPRFETYRVSKAALEHASQQGTRAFKDGYVKFRTCLINLDRLDTELSRSRPTWTGNGIQLQDVENFIRFAVSTHPNTVIEAITLYCNLNYND